ncbi:hypothetical protein N7495_009686 [Penicillium taxi]|uniref:uncharacterized protein n=1 Tax=Penicillium taxi TaxID=168475 RepID=UPI00254525B7|nr:uncharacterized protein N7495_009686 [Penicillium taxi]KAJ5885176.1 hypothetical protein N7495_009686 [Penicillium taxi]
MPLPGTPSPFRVSRRYAPARRVNPQFANSPRFILSQVVAENNELDIDDDDEAPSTTPIAFTPARTLAQKRNIFPRPQRDLIEDSDDGELLRDNAHTPAQSFSTINPHRQRDIIEDSDDGELPRDSIAQGIDTTELAGDAIHSTPPDEFSTHGLLSVQENSPFRSIQDDTKRQRLSTEEQQPLAQKLHTGPNVYKRPTASILSTPGNSVTPFRSKPRFMLSTKKLPNNQPIFRAETPSAPEETPQPERRKLAFVLPRSPSPSAVNESIPAPFSPSSRTLRRRGRPRSGAPSYTPGGMAAEVRSWILEMGSKHEPIATTLVPVESRNDPSRYHMSARVISVRQDMHTSSGPLSFIQAETRSAPSDEKQVFNLVAMGLPRSRPSAPSTGTIQPGNLLGIHRGLTWTVDLESSLSSEPPENGGANRCWLVAMEWELLDDETP